MRFDIITIFPEIFDSYFDESIIKRAREKKLIDIRTHNLRDFTKDKHKKVDDKPYGGGAGMVFMAEPMLRAVGAVEKASPKKARRKIVVPSAKGKQFTQRMASLWAKSYDQIIFLNSRYEGMDERVRAVLRAQEVSIGPYVLMDGDVAAMVMVSAVTRLVPGAITLESLQEESHWNYLVEGETSGRGLEYPHYTRPEVLEWKGKKYRVPKVLLSGDHKKIEEWRKSKEKEVAP
ncbi:tRNA (guanosine(37)-N1)-methyltransferase TrmD [Patescibacteria group bacterium]|nr:tRNA (guanosine(37)-N1)-methyltransferase TrmD [Patescibacteria group bacterium]